MSDIEEKARFQIVGAVQRVNVVPSGKVAFVKVEVAPQPGAQYPDVYEAKGFDETVKQLGALVTGDIVELRGNIRGEAVKNADGSTVQVTGKDGKSRNVRTSTYVVTTVEKKDSTRDVEPPKAKPVIPPPGDDEIPFD